MLDPPLLPLQRYILAILHYLKSALPKLSNLNVENSLKWFLEEISDHYHKLTPKRLPPSTTPAPASGPPPRTPTHLCLEPGLTHAGRSPQPQDSAPC